MMVKSTLPWAILETQKQQFWLISCTHRDGIVFLIVQIRCSPDLIRWPHDGFAKVKMYTRIQHEIEPSCVLQTIFWHVKDFGVARDGAAEGLKNLPTDTRWVKMHSRMVRCLHDPCRICKFPLSCVHRV